MVSPIKAFSSLAKLVDWGHGAPISIECAYLKKDQTRCQRKMAENNLILAKEHFRSHLEMLTGASRGYTRASPQLQILQNIAKVYICGLHDKLESQAIDQWLKELGTRQNSESFKLEDETFETSHTLSEESAEHTEEIEELEHGDEGARWKPDEEEDPFEGEGVSILSNQSTLSIRTVHPGPMMEEDEVARRVTWILKQPIDGPLMKESGYIYVISLPELPGIFKIGITLQHPTLGRFDTHKNCYGDYNKIATEFTQYAHRVERLLLAEFSNNHYQLDVCCKKCKHSHKELLDIDKKTLQRSLKKWIRFIESPAYDRSGLLLTEAQARIPRPASKKFLGSPRNPNSTKRGKSQGFQITPPRPLDFEAPTSIKNDADVDEAEDELCSAIEDLQITPSKSANTRKSRLDYTARLNLVY
ncbi:hypothetical protein N7462_008289 [Penicillium macrosclerotiorum]|uniref:uncharacterized protein n=1 Tax=Penicillium macrosclerotiorum TaxID=303699 RepID=UPI002548E096|nr:uncharacterized protein N7462_008289 [Penicillium macrosclerotiorum]KAJ5675392.1 hypothetical protein N7462_008289 [Penicillium macrosclerotiorum]